MKELLNILDIEEALAPYIPLASEITGKDITLERMWPLMAILGNPERSLRVIHIAGTSGKTSTTYYIAAMLTAAGKKVGMTVSPHIDSIAERVQINMQPISASDFGNALAEFLEIIKTLENKPTYFELLIAFAYWYFAKIGVDYAVVETGLGGLQDSTNVAERPDKICVITDIGYDHMHVLGNTLPEIAAQKAGIIHSGNDVYMYEQKPEVMDVFRQRCDEQKAVLNIVESLYTNDPIGLQDLPEFQQRNWHLAHEVYIALQKRANLPDLTTEMYDETLAVKVPARMDIRTINGKTVIIDGAHNGQKMEAFLGSYKKRWPGQKAAILLSLKSGKDYRDVLPQLVGVADTLIITTFSFSQDTPLHGIEPSELAQFAAQHSFKNIITEPNQTAAYKLLLSQPENLLIITGSFYLIGQLRRNNAELKNA